MKITPRGYFDVSISEEELEAIYEVKAMLEKILKTMNKFDCDCLEGGYDGEYCFDNIDLKNTLECLRNLYVYIPNKMS